jgi:hypothetical protein
MHKFMEKTAEIKNICGIISEVKGGSYRDGNVTFYRNCKRDLYHMIIFADKTIHFEMKTLQKVAFTSVMLAGIMTARAQENPDTSYWSQSGKVGLAFSQVGFSNWASGGDPSVSFNGILNYSFKYEKSPHLWQTVFDAGYGTQRIGNSGKSFKKTDDNLVLITRYGYRISNNFSTVINTRRIRPFLCPALCLPRIPKWEWVSLTIITSQTTNRSHSPFRR